MTVLAALLCEGPATSVQVSTARLAVQASDS
jgi:hypothetical protein